MSQTTDTLSSLLVRRAARTAPANFSARLEEEWLADLHERTSGPSRFAFALGCFWASAAIGRECRPLAVPAGNAATLVPPLEARRPAAGAPTRAFESSPDDRWIRR